MKILIKVTKEILEASKFCNSTSSNIEFTNVGQNCAIARAVVEIFGRKSWVGAENIQIFQDTIKFKNACTLNESDTVCTIGLPYEAIEFIQEFDNTRSEDRVNMLPISFEIDVPDEVIDLIDINHIYKVLSESKTLEMVMEPS